MAQDPHETSFTHQRLLPIPPARAVTRVEEAANEQPASRPESSRIQSTEHHRSVLPIPPAQAVITVGAAADEPSAPGPESSRIQSTEHHRNAEIGGLITEAGSSGVGLLNLTAQIPFQFAQAMMAFGSAIFSSQMKTPERIVQVTQGTISAVRLALSLAMIAEDEPCMDNKNSPLCKSVLIFNLLYIGVLSVAATVAASSQEKSTKPPATVQNV